MRTAICKLMDAGHTAPKLLRYIGKKSIGTTANFGFGVMPLPVSRVPWASKALIAFHGTSRACEARHVVFSLAKSMAQKESVKLLRAVCADWLKTYAPDRNWVLGIHANTGIYHAHLAVANVGSDSKPLKFRPHQAVAMSEMKFTEHAISAKGIGKRGLPVYTKHRRKLAVEELAGLLILPNGDINDPVWKALEKKGSITNFRTRKSGVPISFEYDGRRIRFATLRRFMLDQHKPKPTNQTMPTATIEPNKPLPSKIVSALTRSGFSKTDLTSLERNIKSAHQSQPDPETPTESIEPQTPQK